MADFVAHYSFSGPCGHIRHLTVVDHSEAACQKVLAEERHIPCVKCVEASQGLANYSPGDYSHLFTKQLKSLAKPVTMAPIMDSVRAK